jgi:hypothetical protein
VGKANDHLETYKLGWRNADPDAILGAVSDDFIYDDPIEGRLDKTAFAAYLERLFATSADGEVDDFEEHSDEVVQQDGDEETAWVWFKAGSIEGASLKRVGPDGVRLDRLAFSTPPDTG